jgi:hypothetical protein
MRWFAQHPKLTILKQFAREQKLLPRIPKMVILEYNEKEIDELNEAIKKYIDEDGGVSNLSKIKSTGASESHHSKNIGLNKDSAGTLVLNTSKRLKKQGYVCAYFKIIKEFEKDKKLHAHLDKCNYAIVLRSYLMERYGKKYPVYLAGSDKTESPNNYTTGWCWALIHEFIHVIEIENKKPIFDKDFDTDRGAEEIFSKYLPFSFWETVEPMKD